MKNLKCVTHIKCVSLFDRHAETVYKDILQGGHIESGEHQLHESSLMTHKALGDSRKYPYLYHGRLFGFPKGRGGSRLWNSEGMGGGGVFTIGNPKALG